MGIKRNRRSRRADYQSLDMQDGTYEQDEQGNQNFDDFRSNTENIFPYGNSEAETMETNKNPAILSELSETSKKTQVWTESKSQKNWSQMDEIG